MFAQATNFLLMDRLLLLAANPMTFIVSCYFEVLIKMIIDDVLLL